ncbi:MAG TPA: hypothetical protein VH111_08065 [Steroidobacteraceae bacterium]|jgi:hypothetical protein|nr:hypothetical protein [Steroidobacteraceae bacterium]
MPVALTLVLLVFWLAMAYRSLQRGDLMLAGVFLAVGIVLTIYRLRGASGTRS